MKRTKQEKGITLVALIITIILLLILAVVAIRAVQGDGIINHAKNAQTEYEQAKSEEKSQMLEYEYEIAKATQSTNAETIHEYLVEKLYSAKIGDYVEYDHTKGGTITGEYESTASKNGSANQTFNLESYTGRWRILGVENGKIMLISDGIIKPKNSNYFSIKGENGYIYGSEELDNICEMFGKGNHAISARSIGFNDMAESTVGFNPDSYVGTDWALRYKDTLGHYGKEVTINVNDSGVKYEGNGKTAEFNDPKLFYYYNPTTRKFLHYSDMTEEDKAKTYKLTNSYTEFYPNLYYNVRYDSTTLNFRGWWELLYDDATDDGEYWITGHRDFVNPENGYMSYGMYKIASQGISPENLCQTTSNSGVIEVVEKENAYGIRAVVILEENTQLTYKNTEKDFLNIERNVWSLD